MVDMAKKNPLEYTCMVDDLVENAELT